MFKEGLSTLGVLKLMNKYPAAFHKLFCCSDKSLTSDDIDQTFKAQLDDNGSNGREKQENAVMHQRDYIQNSEGNTVIEYILH